jgi:hypothetical protein
MMNKQFVARRPFRQLNFENLLPKSRRREMYCEEIVEANENEFDPNSQFESWKSNLSQDQFPTEKDLTYLNSLNNPKKRTSAQLLKENKPFFNARPGPFFQFSKKPTLLSRKSVEFMPTSKSEKLKKISKNLQNLNCNETIVISDSSSKAKEIPNELCSKSGRIPNEMKYKTELCKNYLEGRVCPYQNRCRFAHGYGEVNTKIIINSRYRSRICESYHKNLFCTYGSRWLFRHYDFEQDYERKYFTNVLRSNFELQEVSQAQKLYDVLQKLKARIKFNDKSKTLVLLTKKLLFKVTPTILDNKRPMVYKRLPVFSQLTEESSTEIENCIATDCLKKLKALDPEEYILCKIHLTTLICPQVAVILKSSSESSKQKDKEFQLCYSLIMVFKYPVKKKEIRIFDNLLKS